LACGKLWDDLIQEEIGLEIVSVRVEEIQSLSLIRKMKKGGKEG